MNILVILVPVSLVLAGLALFGFLWTLRHSQYEDLDGDAARILLDDEYDDHPKQD
ncbi:cbb3-type cytochrome oxidase assembly protein CcoS [Yoonia sp.]|uniref:cbb3-type cytochrome oxidase assembly protein CcoS n=1 Tax=Yoonia sp. TaxID=2212373 RepID=UPI0019F5403E|nr:cbb3-type cytochrome oxidase assembly protein CcoS [Yoonia sp.]MBE0412973.1 cbb3-type cytochrome oxidase assembly protein CcoS [Yoonia sp.]